MAETYAIIETGGKQYRAQQGTKLTVDRLKADEGAKVTLRPVMFRSDDNVVIGGDDLEKVKVEAKVAGHVRGEKLRVFTYKPKSGQRKRKGHRSELTKLEITEVKMLSRRPAKKASEKKPAETKASATKTSETKTSDTKGESE